MNGRSPARLLAPPAPAAAVVVRFTVVIAGGGADPSSPIRAGRLRP